MTLTTDPDDLAVKRKKARHRAYYLANRDRILAAAAANREKKRAYDAAYYASNRAKRLSQHRAWYEANQEQVHAYRSANRERHSQQDRARRDAMEAEKRENWLAQKRAYMHARVAETRAHRKIYNSAYRASNRELLLAYDRARQSTERRKQWKVEYIATYALELSERRRAYYLANQKRQLLRRRIYAAEHPEQEKVSRHRRRAKENAAPGQIKATEWRDLVNRSQRCHWCGRKFTKTRKPTLDHVTPLSKGGANSIQNAVCACRSCNSSKKDRLLHPITRQGILL